MKVVVSGGGVGGLTLAQGLLRSGHEVIVFERGALPDGPSGFRLRLDSRAVAVLEQLLPPSVHTALLASGPGLAAHRRRVILDRRLRELASEPEDDNGILMIGRGPLQRLLAHGLEERVHWNAEVASYRVNAEDVEVVLSDGHVEHADLVVAADGLRSPLRRQLLGDTGYRSLAIKAISGRIPGRPADLGLDRLAGILAKGYAVASGPREIALFVTTHDPDRGPAIDPAAVGPVPADREDPYLVWQLTGPDQDLPLAEGGPSGLAAGAEELLDGWHPDLRRLPALSDRSSIERYGLHAAPAVPLWPTTAVTVLGDAIHVVPPSGGIGASTAIRDAGHLVAELDGLDEQGELGDPVDRAELLQAVRRYEDTMRGYADGVVDGSVAPLRWQRRIRHPLVHGAATAALIGVRAARELVQRRPSTSPASPSTRPMPSEKG